MQEPGFWDDPEKSNQKMREAKNLKDIVETVRGLESQYEDIMTLIEMGYEDNDPAIIPDISEELETFKKTFEEIRVSTLLSGIRALDILLSVRAVSLPAIGIPWPVLDAAAAAESQRQQCIYHCPEKMLHFMIPFCYTIVIVMMLWAKDYQRTDCFLTQFVPAYGFDPSIIAIISG